MLHGGFPKLFYLNSPWFKWGDYHTAILVNTRTTLFRARSDCSFQLCAVLCWHPSLCITFSSWLTSAVATIKNCVLIFPSLLPSTFKFTWKYVSKAIYAELFPSPFQALNVKRTKLLSYNIKKASSVWSIIYISHWLRVFIEHAFICNSIRFWEWSHIFVVRTDVLLQRWV